MEKTRKVKEKISWDIVDSVPLSGRIEKVIKGLQDFKKRCRKAGYSEITIDIWGYEDVSVDACGKRPETEKEKVQRLKRVEHAKKMNEAKRLKRALKKSERQLYEELRAKYEKV